MLCNKCRAGFLLLFYLTFCFSLYFLFFGGTVGGFMHRNGNLKDVFFCFVCLVCTVTTHSGSELLTVFVSGCSTSCGHLPRISVVLLCLSLFLFLSYFLNHSFSVVSAGSWYHSSACNHNRLCLLILISKEKQSWSK